MRHGWGCFSNFPSFIFPEKKHEGRKRFKNVKSFDSKKLIVKKKIEIFWPDSGGQEIWNSDENFEEFWSDIWTVNVKNHVGEKLKVSNI